MSKELNGLTDKQQLIPDETASSVGMESRPALVSPPLEPLYQRTMSSTPDRKPMWRMLVAPAWFLLGILVGLGIFAGYSQLTTKPAPPPAQTLDAAQVKQAAKEGLLQAIQELQAQSSGNNGQGPQAIDKNAIAMRDANILGDKNAKVSIVEYADFQCPFCGRHHAQVEPALIQEFVNTGKANLVYKHLAFLGPESVDAAVAAECAADQGKFWEYHNYLFEHQGGENTGEFTKDKLIGFGQTVGLETTKFAKCVTNDETIARVQADSAEAQKFGVTSTPTFFINGVPFVGLKSPDEFRKAIQQVAQ